jgi:hypothetical protein
VGAEKLLSWLKVTEKKVALTPQVIAALGVLLGALSKAVAEGAAAAGANGLNLALDEQTWADIMAVWPQLKATAQDLGIKF